MPLSLTLAIESLLMPMFIGAIILTLLVAARLLFKSTSRFEVLLGTGAVLASITGLLVHGISDHYTGVGFNEAALFHLKHGLKGLKWGILWPIVSVTVVVALMSIGVFEIGRRRRRGRASQAAGPPRPLSKKMAIIYLVMLALNPAMVQSAVMAGHAANWDEYYDEVSAWAVDVQASQVQAPREPRSFIYIYAESLEAAFLDEDRWPGLAPNLGRMETNPSTLSLRALRQAPGTGWTIAGMVASQCGFPVSAQELPATAPAARGGVTCLGDLLDEAGYTTSYMGGARLGFSNKGEFYKAHGFDRVRGDQQLSQAYPDKDLDQSEWGLYDDDLFDMALDEFDSLARKDQPFALFLLTLDTHPHDGFENRHCKRVGRYTDDKEFDMLDAVHCSDRLIHEFIQKIRGRPGGEDVVIVVASDHLQATNSRIRRQLGFEHKRSNLWMAQGPGVKGMKVDREATTLDIAPTLAQLLGMDVPALGLGRSLLEPRPTMIEEMGMSGLYARLRAVFGGIGNSREQLSKNEILQRFSISEPVADPSPTPAQQPAK